MLINCQECELQVSDKAISCPHCGFPLRPNAVRAPRKRTNKRRRLPNGFGQISEIKNQNLRKPFRAMVTVGKTSTGRPICKPLKPEAFFATYNEAYEALVNYNKNPYDLEPALTMSELYDKWTEAYFKTLKSKSSERSVVAAWAYCSPIHNMRVIDVRARHLKSCMDEGTIVVGGNIRHATAITKSRIKSVFNLMLDYAVEYEIVDRNYARTFAIADEIVSETKKTKSDHIPMTDEEMDKLWENVDRVNYADAIIIQAYCGWRPQELGLIRLENIDLDNWFFTGGMKTDAGTDRVVPIHPRIRTLVQRRYDEALELKSEYLINCTDGRIKKNNLFMNYNKYKKRFDNVMEILGLNAEHRPHDPRVHFVTMAKKYNVDEYAIKRIIGHSITDLTENTYTHRDVEWLQSEVKKIK